jgi:hypothetical protein
MPILGAHAATARQTCALKVAWRRPRIKVDYGDGNSRYRLDRIALSYARQRVSPLSHPSIGMKRGVL